MQVKADNVAVFKNRLTNETIEHKFDYLHAVPPMSGLDYLKDSKLVDENNYVTVDKFTLRHVKYPNVWSLGDSSNLPTSKTQSAIFEQAYILEQNLVRVYKDKQPDHNYDGYTACPIVVSLG